MHDRAWVFGRGCAEKNSAARCLKNNSEVYTLLRDGKVSLCSLSQVAKVITEENKGEVLELVQGLPKQEAERLAARYSAPEKVKRETIRVKRVLVENRVSIITAPANVAATDQVAVEERFFISFDVDAESMELINQAKCHCGGDFNH